MRNTYIHTERERETEREYGGIEPQTKEYNHNILSFKHKSLTHFLNFTVKKQEILSYLHISRLFFKD
jgi:hypothetical protein